MLLKTSKRIQAARTRSPRGSRGPRGLPWSPVPSKWVRGARARSPRGFASRGLPWSPVLIWLFLYCWLLVSRGLPWPPSPPVVSRGLPPRGLPYCFCCFFTVGPWSPVVSRGPRRLPWSPVVSRIDFAVSLLLAPGLPWSPVAPVASRGLPPRGLPYCFYCFFTVGSWSPVAPVAPRRLPWSRVVSRLVSYCFGCFFTVGSRGLP